MENVALGEPDDQGYRAVDRSPPSHQRPGRPPRIAEHRRLCRETSKLILYVAMLILPMALPEGASIDKLLRAIIMIALFWSAYTAEAVRGGPQAIPPGQPEAASALGLGCWRIMRLIVLPQAFGIIIPALVNLVIGFLLATSLLTVIGIFDLLNAAKASATDPSWLGFYDEAYLVAALIYFAFGIDGSRYSQWLEHRLKGSQRRSGPFSRIVLSGIVDPRPRLGT